MDANTNVNTHASTSDPWSPRSLKWYSRFLLACLLLVYGMHARHVWLCAQPKCVLFFLLALDTELTVRF